MHDHLATENAFAFRVHLERQGSGMDLEDRQAVLRCLDRDLPTCLALLLRSLLRAQDRLHRLYVQRGSRAIDQTLEHLLHHAATFEKEVAAILHLEQRHRVTKRRPLLVVAGQGEAQTLVKPTLTDLPQAPYSVWRTQGVCDKLQAGSVGKLRETVVLLAETNLLLRCLRSHVLVPVEHDHCRERRMATHANRHMTPLGVPDVERVVVHVRSLSPQIDAAFAEAFHVPDRRRRAIDQDEKNPGSLRSGRQMLLGEVVLAFSRGDSR